MSRLTSLTAVKSPNFLVTRLIRTAYGPFQLGNLPKGAVEEVNAKVMRDQLGLDDNSELLDQARQKWPAWVAADPRLGVVEEFDDLRAWLPSVDSAASDDVLLALAMLAAPDGGDDIAAAAAAAPGGVFDNSGQDCCSRSRLLVQRGIYDEFMAALEESVGDFAAADPTLPDTAMGPLVTAAHRDKVASYVAAGEVDFGPSGVAVLVGEGRLLRFSFDKLWCADLP